MQENEAISSDKIALAIQTQKKPIVIQIVSSNLISREQLHLSIKLMVLI